MMRRARNSVAAVWLCALVIFAGTARADDRCKGLLPTETAKLPRSSVTPDHLVKLRDIGQPYAADPARPLFTLSPDKKSIAFQLHRADPETNSYCAGLVVLPLHPGAKRQLIDISHELIMDRPAWYGWSAFQIGTPAPITPRWLPNGKLIAYLKRDNGSNQVWLASLEGANARQITKSPTDVDDFRLSEDDQTIIYSTRPGIPEHEREIDLEGLSGWRYDERAFPVRGGRPQVPATSSRYIVVDIETGAERAATEVESRVFGVGEDQPRRASGPGQREAWIETKGTQSYPPDYRLIATIGTDRFDCPSNVCKLDRSSMIGWTSDGAELIFTRREGWANSLTGIYLWRPETPSASRAIVTSDALIECQPSGNGLLCLREGSSAPRHFVKFDLRKKEAEKLFDPNPEFDHLLLGRVERLNWRNGFGVPWYGDLVYPVGYRAGQRYPMVIVQYRTKGFLRGSTGDEIPIQTLAKEGYFILSVDNLTYEDIIGKRKDAGELAAAFNQNFAGRRQILSAIETAISSLEKKGLIATDKVGISGLSDGCTTAKFAAINSVKFAAGSVSGCALEPDQDAILGPMVAQAYHESGWPRLAVNDVGFWSKIAFMSQPERVRFPMLFQAADNEFLAMVGSHTALRQIGTPSDLYIFPDEDHIKSQPAHRLAIYHRNLAWFNFWLKDELPQNPARREEAERWKMMRDEWKLRGPVANTQARSLDVEDQ
jgi:hypothetical protein